MYVYTSTFSLYLHKYTHYLLRFSKKWKEIRNDKSDGFNTH